jgi:hypothetical protein
MIKFVPAWKYKKMIWEIICCLGFKARAMDKSMKNSF